MKNPPPILTVHGLWNRGPEAWLLRRRLKRLTGRAVVQFRYPSVARGFSRNAERLAASIEQGPGPVDLVGHSLGGAIGQADAQTPASGSGYSLQGGFWHKHCAPVVVQVDIT